MIWKFEIVLYIYVLKTVPHEPNICPYMSACSLRESSQSGWIHAIVFYATGLQQLRKTTRLGWLYATGGCRDMGDKAGFHAIETIGGVDDKP